MTEKNYQEIIKNMQIGECKKLSQDFYFKIDNDYGIKTKIKHNKEYEFEIVCLNEKTEGGMIKKFIINNLKPEEIMANKSLCDNLLKDDNFKTKLINNQEIVKQILINQDKIQDIFNKCDSKEKEKLLSDLLKKTDITQKSILALNIKQEKIEQLEKLLEDDKNNESVYQKFFAEQESHFLLGNELGYYYIISDSNRTCNNSTDEHGGNIIDLKGVNCNSYTIVEIKKPNEKIFKTKKNKNNEPKEGRNNIYEYTDEFQTGISQLLEYTQKKVENNSIKGNKECIYNATKLLIIGRDSEFKNTPKEQQFNRYREAFKDIKILTYDEILDKAKRIFFKNNNEV